MNDIVFTLATLFSGLSFLIYGTACLTSLHMKNEFIRFGIGRYRNLTGALQVLGGLGLITGYLLSPFLAFFASAGLALLMIFGFVVRIKIRDSLLVSMPAFLYALVNIYLSLHYYNLLS